MRNFCTADPHFGHSNIIKYCNRPFKDSDTMNKALAYNWNARVKDEDTIFIVGDFFVRNSKSNHEMLKELIKQLNGHKIFIRGNHDKNNSVKTKITSLQINYAGIDINLVHKPEDYNPKYCLNVVGHCHNAFKTIKGKSNSIIINCGVDQWRYMPITMEEILTEFRLAQKNIKKLKKLEDYYEQFK